MEQIALPMLHRYDAPSVVHPAEIAACKTYREAVKLCWRKRRVRNMTQQMLAAEAGLHPSHVSCYLHDGKRQRDLPGWAIKVVEHTLGNSAISQFNALNAKLGVEEERYLTQDDAA